MDYPYHFPGGPSQEAEPTHQPHGEPSDQPAIQAANETFEEYVEPPMKWDDLFLPRANVTAIMKKAVPANALIATDAKELMGECVSEFIQFITSEASEKCSHERRKTVTGKDILTAMSDLSMENYALALRPYLNKYLEVRSGRAKKVPSGAAGESSQAPGSEAVLEGQSGREPKEATQ